MDETHQNHQPEGQEENPEELLIHASNEGQDKMPENPLEKYGWKFNPFVFEIMPDVIVGHEKERDEMVELIREGHKAIMLLGPTGAGKTTLLRWLEKRIGNCMFLSKPPSSQREFVEFFNSLYPRPLFLFFLGPRFRTMFDVVRFLKRSRKRRVLIIDEAHESPKEILEWIRVFTDQVEGLTVILSGLPRLDDELRRKVETLHNRIIRSITLGPLSKEEVRELIEKRIRAAGGEGLGPFTDDDIEEIYKASAGYPREVLRVCSAMLEGRPRTQPKPSHFEAFPELTGTQLEILNVLMNGEMTPSDIVEMLGPERYKSKAHGVRSVNNILKFLMEEGLVGRRRSGRGFVYFLLPKARNVLVES